MAIKPLFADQATAKRPKSNNGGPAQLHSMFRDQFTISTLMLLGGLFQAVLFLLPIRKLYAIAPVVILLSVRIVDHLLMAAGITRNRYMDGVIMGKFAMVFPGADGSFDSANKSAPANDKVAVLILGARSNHPLGIFGPGVKTIQDYYDSMLAELEREPEKWGFLGASNWLGSGDRKVSNETMTIFYFSAKEHVHAFAHSPIHRAGWDWWNRITKTHKHIAIMHELYEVPAGSWESIYANYHPTGLASTTHAVKDSKGEKLWMSGIVDASRGKMRTSPGRMGLDNGSGNEKYGPEIYADQYA